MALSALALLTSSLLSRADAFFADASWIVTAEDVQRYTKVVHLQKVTKSLSSVLTMERILSRDAGYLWRWRGWQLHEADGIRR